MAELSLHVLGPFRITARGVSIRSLHHATGQLIACLVVHMASGRSLSKSRIATLLWPDLPESEASRKTASAHHSIRRMLRNHNLPCNLFRDLAETAASQLVWLDVREFMRLAQSSQAADWLAAITLYKGDLLEDVDADWVVGLRTAVRDTYLRTLERATTSLLMANTHDQALLLARRWLQEDPLNDAACVVCMRALVAAGRPALALQEYVLFAQRLHEELAIGPLPKTQEMADAIRAQHVPLAAPDIPNKSSLPNNLGGANGEVVMPLARAQTALGKSLATNDRMLVRLHVNLGEADALILSAEGKSALRRHRIVRLVQQAYAQSALMTDADLARVLDVNVRTIERDMADLRRAGYIAATRRRIAISQMELGATANSMNVGEVCRNQHVFAHIQFIQSDIVLM